MRISASTEYGARVLVRLATLPRGESMSAERLALLENIPRAYVDQIFQRLRRGGLVESHRGARGGYVLALPPEAVTVGMMVRAVEGRVFEDVCERYIAGEDQCSHLTGCGIRPVWQNLTRLVEDFLDKVTLRELMADSPQAARSEAFHARD